MGVEGKPLQKGIRRLLRERVLIFVVMVSRMCKKVKTHQTVLLNIWGFKYKLHLKNVRNMKHIKIYDSSHFY